MSLQRYENFCIEPPVLLQIKRTTYFLSDSCDLYLVDSYLNNVSDNHLSNRLICSLRTLPTSLFESLSYKCEYYACYNEINM